MDPLKLKNKRWTALVPQRQRHLIKSPSKPIHLIGKLPEEAYIQIYTYIGLSDIVNLALTCRQLAALSHNETVWRNKLKVLDWKGDHPVEAAKVLARQKGQLDDASLASEERASRRISLGQSSNLKKPTQPITTTSKTSDAFTSNTTANASKRASIASPHTLSHTTPSSVPNQSTSTIPPKASNTGIIDDTDDDGFGDFVDFASDPTTSSSAHASSNPFISPNPNDINGSFSHIDLNAQPLQPTRASANGSSQTPKKQEEDLLMMFDDGVEDIGLGHATPAVGESKASTNTANLHGSASTRRNSAHLNGQSSALNASANSTASSNAHHSTSLSRDLFIAYFKYLMPYYISLQYQSTSSLIFTQSHPVPLSDIEKSYILSNLKRLLSNKIISPTQYEETRLKTTRRNLQNSIDYFDAFLLNKFERANDQRIISKMREAAWASYALNTNSADEGVGTTTSSSSSSSVIQVFINKIPLFYDNSWDPLANLTKTFDMTGQLVDGIDFSAMDSFMNHVIGTVQKEGTTIARVFPPDSDALVYFTDRIANDVISDYIVPLLNAAHNLTNPLFLLTTAATFGQLQRLIETVCSIEPKSSAVTMTTVSKVVYDMFRPYTSDYLKEEPNWCREYLNEICIQWEHKLAEERANRNRDPTFLNAQNTQQVKKNILAGFTKALLLPVTIVPKTVALSVNAITQGSTMAFNAMTGTFTSSSSSAAAAAAAANGNPKVITSTAPPAGNVAVSARNSGTSTPPITPSTSEKKEFPSLHGESFQSLISIETAMQLIQADRECLKRVQTFAGYAGDVGLRVKRVIEEIFVILCQTVSANHLTPAFAKATEQMGQYKPADHAVDESVAPLVQFFELVHIGDTILQMVQVYYDREMVKYIDKNDFLSQVVREKKKFENALDESVASGLNAGVNILMTQAEYILQTQQETSDFCPELKNGMNGSKNAGVIDIEGPTKAAEAVVDCLRSHCQMLKGSTDKAILEVFHQEVGLRLHGMLLKHLKKSIVSISGGFQVIADLNLYTSFINSLKLPNVNPYFTALKMAANVFIIDSPRDLGMMARDLERYEGTLRIEDIMEMVQCRTDWKKIEREVEKEVFGFKTEDCLIA